MYWIVLLGVLGHDPGTTVHRSVAEIRRSLNRIDDLALAALEAEAKKSAEKHKEWNNVDRLRVIRGDLSAFCINKLNISGPRSNAESAVLFNLASQASTQYDKQEKPVEPVIQKQWLDTMYYGRVWGWKDTKTGFINFFPGEQPPRQQILTVPTSVYYLIH